MIAYVINLPPTADARLSRERRRHVLHQLASCPAFRYRFVQSVDGDHLTPEQQALVDPGVLRFKPWLAGCALSHFQAYREILDAGDDVACILEDDAALAPTVESDIASILPHMSANEVVLLHWSTPSHAVADLSSCNAPRLPNGSILAEPMDLRMVSSACAYLITRGACETMLAHGLPVRAGADASSLFREWGAIGCVRVVTPRLVNPSVRLKSTIHYRTQGSLLGRLSRVSAHHRWLGLHLLAHYYRARIARHGGRYRIVDQPALPPPPET